MPRDDVDKLPIPKSAKKYARMKGPKMLGPSKFGMYSSMVADIANQGDKSLKIKDEGGKVDHTWEHLSNGDRRRIADALVTTLLS